MRISRPATRGWATCAAQWIGCLLAVLGLAAAGLASPVLSDEDRATAPSGPTVLVGVGGLRWSDIDAQGTPMLWDLVANGAVGSISVRTVNPLTCPIDAWLTLSAGRRALGAPSELAESASHPAAPAPSVSSTGDSKTVDSSAVSCPELPAVDTGRVSGWRYFVQLQRTELASYGEPGLLGDELRAAGACVLAVGPGAAVALATSDGRVGTYAPRLADADLSICPVAIVDGGNLPATGIDRLTALHRLDARLSAVVDRLPADAQLLVAGVADVPGVQPGLQVVIEAGADSASDTWLTSNSTRRTGLVQLTDLTATLLTRAGAADVDTDGAPLLTAGPRRLDTAETIRNRVDLAVLTDVLPALAPWLGAAYLVAIGVPVAVATLIWWRRRERGEQPRLPSAWRRVLKVIGIAASAVPVSTYLATLTSWWTSPVPAVALIAVAVGIVVVLTWLAVAPPSQRLRSAVWGPATVISAVTFTVLTADALTGTPLQIGSPLVAGPVTGGRFYGFSNVTFGVYVSSALLLIGGLVQLLIGQGHRRAASAVAAAIAALAVGVVGWPAFGADFGGLLAMLPAFAYLVIAVAGGRMTRRRIALSALAAVACAGLVSVIDWLRPADQRSHFGGFVQMLIDGQADDLVLRKAAAAADSLTTPVGLPALIVLVLSVLVVVRPEWSRSSGLRSLSTHWTLLPVVLRASLVLAVLGSLVNDSGLIVAGTMAMTVAPLVLAAGLSRPPGPERTAALPAAGRLASDPA